MIKAGLAAGAVTLSACVRDMQETTSATAIKPVDPAASPVPTAGVPGGLEDRLTEIKMGIGYNNYYEFTTNKVQVERLAQGFPMSPWEVKVTGLVDIPRSYSVEELIQLFEPEERIYRMRCVEAWSMVLPWTGFPLHKLIEAVHPKPEAKYVEFISAADDEHMPGLKEYSFPWPYTEGLRMDEAMHDLTILATGIYGEPLPPQSGGPIRVVVPWKYGFKSAKAIVKINFRADEPLTFWSAYNPREYGFYANVNPEVDHPRWSQAKEKRIGDKDFRDTLMFNGYGDQVAALYQGMDLAKNF